MDPGDPDDFATITEALAAAGPGDTVKVKAGVYNESVVITQPNLELKGEDGAILDGECVEGAAIEVQADGVTVKDLEIMRYEVGIEVKESTGSEIKKNHISNTSDAIVLDEAFETEVKDNVVLGGDACGDPDDGIESEDGGSNWILDNLIEGVGGTGIILDDEDNVVDDNELISTEGDGINVGGDDNEVTDNDVIGSESDGVCVDGDENLFDDNEVVGSDAEGFDIDGAENSFFDSRCDANGDDAMEIGDDSPGGNVLCDNVATGDLEDGFDSEGPFNLLEDNKAYGNAQVGFRLENLADDNVLCDNKAENNGEHGFLLDGVTGNHLEDNEAEDNGGFGFVDNSGPDAASVLNSYDDNECEDNVLGGSSPAGLCDDD